MAEQNRIGGNGQLQCSGVYAIRNNVNRKCYVGSARTSFERRWSHHRRDLRNRRHHSVTLQRAWDKYGTDSFEFVVLEVTLPEHAVGVEQVMIDFYKSANPEHGYNMSPAAGSTRGMKGRKASPETRVKQSAVARNRSEETIERIRQAALNMSGEARARITAGAKAAGSMTSQRMLLAARKASPETCKKISMSLTGKTLSEETRAKISASRKGRKLTPEHIEAQKRGRKEAAIRRSIAVANSVAQELRRPARIHRKIVL